MFHFCKLLCIIFVPIISALGPSSGPVGPITLYTFHVCPENNINKIALNMNLNVDDNDVRSLSFSADIPVDIDEETQASIVIDKWDMNSWQKNFYTNDGSIKEMLQLYSKTLWGNIANTVEPQLENPNFFIPAGHYQMTDYMDTYKSIDVPHVFYGRFRIYVTITTNDDEDLLCLMSEMETHDP